MDGRMGGQVYVGGPCSPLFLWLWPCPQPTPPSAHTHSPTEPSLRILTPYSTWKGQGRRQKKVYEQNGATPHHTGPKTALIGLSRQIPYRGSFKDPRLAQALGVLTTMPGLCGKLP